MSIDVSVEYNGSGLPNTILLTLCHFRYGGTRLNVMKKFCPYILCSHPPKGFDNVSPDWVDSQKVYREMHSSFF